MELDPTNILPGDGVTGKRHPRINFRGRAIEARTHGRKTELLVKWSGIQVPEWIMKTHLWKRGDGESSDSSERSTESDGDPNASSQDSSDSSSSSLSEGMDGSDSEDANSTDNVGGQPYRHLAAHVPIGPLAGRERGGRGGRGRGRVLEHQWVIITSIPKKMKEIALKVKTICSKFSQVPSKSDLEPINNGMK